MSRSANRASAESTPADSSTKKTHSKQTRDKPRGAPKAARCDVRRKGAVPSNACSDKECSTSHDLDRDDGEREWRAHSGWCALPKLFRLEGKKSARREDEPSRLANGVPPHSELTPGCELQLR